MAANSIEDISNLLSRPEGKRLCFYICLFICLSVLDLPDYLKSYEGFWWIFGMEVRAWANE